MCPVRNSTDRALLFLKTEPIDAVVILFYIVLDNFHKM